MAAAVNLGTGLLFGIPFVLKGAVRIGPVAI
jgi:hypothetical protein